MFADKPGQPEGPLEASEVTAESMKLSWKPPVDNGGAEITGLHRSVYAYAVQSDVYNMLNL